MDQEETKRKVEINNLLLQLSDVFDAETLPVLRACARSGQFEDLYHRLQRVWDLKRHADNTNFINVIILTGLATGRTSREIAQDMA